MKPIYKALKPFEYSPDGYSKKEVEVGDLVQFENPRMSGYFKDSIELHQAEGGRPDGKNEKLQKEFDELKESVVNVITNVYEMEDEQLLKLDKETHKFAAGIVGAEVKSNSKENTFVKAIKEALITPKETEEKVGE